MKNKTIVIVGATSSTYPFHLSPILQHSFFCFLTYRTFSRTLKAETEGKDT